MLQISEYSEVVRAYDRVSANVLSANNKTTINCERKRIFISFRGVLSAESLVEISQDERSSLHLTITLFRLRTTMVFYLYLVQIILSFPFVSIFAICDIFYVFTIFNLCTHGIKSVASALRNRHLLGTNNCIGNQFSSFQVTIAVCLL
jgi:hypothetical protein